MVTPRPWWWRPGRVRHRWWWRRLVDQSTDTPTRMAVRCTIRIGTPITATMDAGTVMTTVTTDVGMVAIDNRSVAASDRP